MKEGTKVSSEVFQLLKSVWNGYNSSKVEWGVHETYVAKFIDCRKCHKYLRGYTLYFLDSEEADR